MRRIRTIAVLPTMFTLGNLVCGFFAIVIASRVDAPTKDMLISQFDPENCAFSGWLIFAAMIFDALDGYVARLSRTASDFGRELDSLCDVVTFGVAPGFLLVKICPKFALIHRPEVWMIAAAYAACAALRLARFNVETIGDDDHLHFKGLPSPAAAAVIAAFAILFHALRRKEDWPVLADFPRIDSTLQTLLPFFAAGVALLMVSRIPYPHLVNRLLRGRRSLGFVVAILFGFLLIMIMRDYALAIMASAFALSGPVRLALRRMSPRRAPPVRPPPADSPPLPPPGAADSSPPDVLP